jgi:hypothetical protein
MSEQMLKRRSEILPLLTKIFGTLTILVEMRLSSVFFLSFRRQEESKALITSKTPPVIGMTKVPTHKNCQSTKSFKLSLFHLHLIRSLL